jgi:hypothetical protein
MRRLFLLILCGCVVAGVALAQYGKPAGQPTAKPGAKPDFELTATYIEACSCDMFCPCYFSQGKESHPHPTMHGIVLFCKANLVL